MKALLNHLIKFKTLKISVLNKNNGIVIFVFFIVFMGIS